MLSQLRKALRTGIVTEPASAAALPDTLGTRVADEVRQLFGRSLHIRQVDAGSCNGCELEISNLTNPYYDLERFGLHFVASPRHWVVTGPAGELARVKVKDPSFVNWPALEYAVLKNIVPDFPLCN